VNWITWQPENWPVVISKFAMPKFSF